MRAADLARGRVERADPLLLGRVGRRPREDHLLVDLAEEQRLRERGGAALGRTLDLGLGRCLHEGQRTRAPPPQSRLERRRRKPSPSTAPAGVGGLSAPPGRRSPSGLVAVAVLASCSPLAAAVDVASPLLTPEQAKRIERDQNPIEVTLSFSGDLLIHSPVWGAALAQGGGSDYDFARAARRGRALRRRHRPGDLPRRDADDPGGVGDADGLSAVQHAARAGEGDRRHRLGRVRHRARTTASTRGGGRGLDDQGTRQGGHPAHRLGHLRARAAKAADPRGERGQDRLPRLHHGHQRDPGAEALHGQHRRPGADRRRRQARAPRPAPTRSSSTSTGRPRWSPST